MEWLICGTIPQVDFPLCLETWSIKEENEYKLVSGDKTLPVLRGTPALMASCMLACEVLGTGKVQSLLVGDTGKGIGSKALYAKLAEELLPQNEYTGITFHYLFPDVDWHNKILIAVQAKTNLPLLVADAGFMYAAKMSGYASAYQLFTPDVGEMAFLADEKAPHPFYTRGFLLAEDEDIPLLLSRAKEHKNVPQNLVIKGKKDYIVQQGEIIMTIDSPSVPAMEAIGGTGDLLTGLATAFLINGMSLTEASIEAARLNRKIAQMANPNPATQVGELLKYIKKAMV